MINYSSKVVPLLQIITISILIIVVTPKNGKAQCLRNFPSLQQIRSPSRPLVNHPTGRQYLFPSIKFKCNTFITKIIYKGDVWTNSSFYPVIQLYEEGVPIVADYLLEQGVQLNKLSSVEQGDSGTVILTPKSPIEVEDNSVLGVYLSANSTSFLFEDNPLHTSDIYYENSSKSLLLFHFVSSVRQRGLVPLITVETMTSTSTTSPSTISPSTISPSTTMSSSSTTTIITSTSRYETSTHTTITNTSTNMPNNIMQTTSNVPLTKTSSNTPLVSSTIQTMTISSSSTSNNNTVYPATVSITNLASEPPAVIRTTNNYHISHWVIIVTVVGCVIMIFLLSFMTVICVLTYLKRAKYELEIKQNNTQQHSRQAQDSVHIQQSDHSPHQNTQERETSLQCNSMVINEPCAYGEQYNRLTRDTQQYSHLTRPVGVPHTNTYHCLDKDYCHSDSPSGIFSTSLSFPNGFQQPLPSQAAVSNPIYNNNIHHYEEPDLYSAPKNYERSTYHTLYIDSKF